MEWVCNESLTHYSRPKAAYVNTRGVHMQHMVTVNQFMRGLITPSRLCVCVSYRSSVFHRHRDTTHPCRSRNRTLQCCGRGGHRLLLHIHHSLYVCMCVYVYMHVSRKCENLWNQRYKQMKVSNIYGHFEYT